MEKFGLISYNSINIGDEIQSIAASRFIPEVNYYINREKLSLFKAKTDGTRIRLIMNAWYMWRPKYFVPPKAIQPLLISMCFGKRIQKKSFLSKRVKHFLLDNGPVGCRDNRTLDYLTKNGIPAYFSGCLTSTLIGGERHPQNYILCLDLNVNIVEFIKKEANCPVYDLSKFFSPYINSKNRYRLAKAVLYSIKNAKAIVTTNFHTALPAMAFNTPCCLIKPDGDGGDFEGRLQGYENILKFYSEADFLSGKVFDINNPSPVIQTKEFVEMKTRLEEKCTLFTGFDSKKPIFEDGYNPLLDVFEFLRYNRGDINRVLMHAKRLDLIKTTIKRFVGKNYLDLK